MASSQIAVIALVVLCCWELSCAEDHHELMHRSIFLPCATSCFGKYELCISPTQISENDQVRCIHTRNGCEKVCIDKMMKKKKFKRGEEGCHDECNALRNKCFNLREADESGIWRKRALCNLLGDHCTEQC